MIWLNKRNVKGFEGCSIWLVLHTTQYSNKRICCYFISSIYCTTWSQNFSAPVCIHICVTCSKTFCSNILSCIFQLNHDNWPSMTSKTWIPELLQCETYLYLKRLRRNIYYQLLLTALTELLPGISQCDVCDVCQCWLKMVLETNWNANRIPYRAYSRWFWMLLPPVHSLSKFLLSNLLFF